jgi:Uma2 family endonuclease
MTPITSLSQLNLDGTYSYADYLLWQFEERVELLKGKILAMSPAPNMRHQRIARNICTELLAYFKKNRCQVFFAPFDVRLYNRKISEKKNKEVYTVVQPDICIICNPEMLDENGCNGAPDLIVEILSPGNAKTDLKDKYALYAEAGVREYWIVYPAEESIAQFVLNDEQQYQLVQLHANEGFITPVIFPELNIDLADIFGE